MPLSKRAVATYTSERWLSKELLVTLAPEGRGETQHYDHIDCPAGVDTKGRLYVTRTDADVLLGYCHHCGMRGVHRGAETPNIHTTTPKLFGPDDPVTEALTKDPKNFAARYLVYCHAIQAIDSGFNSTGACGYMRSMCVNFALAEQDGWLWGHEGFGVECYPVLVFPSFDADGYVVGMQVKRILTEEQKVAFKKAGIPKTLTRGKVQPHIINFNDSETVIICEDRISGLRIAEAGFAACVMHGSPVMQANVAQSLSLMYDGAVVWYDNDSEVVLKHAEETVQVLRLFFETSKVLPVYTHADPKKYSVTLIAIILESAADFLGAV